MKTQFLIFLFFIITISCSNDSINSLNNDARDVSTIFFEDISYDIVVNPIVSDEPIESIMSISGNNMEFVALDSKLQTMYLIKNDTVVSKHKSVGRGPKEYSNITEIAYSPERKTLYAYSPDKKGIFCYKMPKFEYVKSIRVFPEITGMHLIDNGNIIISCYNYEPSHNDCGIFLIDPQTESINKVISTNYTNSIFTSSASFFQKLDTLFFTLPESKTTIYKYYNDTLKPKLCINYKDMNFKKGLCDTDGNEMSDMIKFLTYRDEKDYAIGCYYMNISDSIFSYWHHPHINKKYHDYLTVCKNGNCNNYIINIEGIKYRIFPQLLYDNIYSMIIEGDWQKKIDKNQNLSITGNKIIKTMKEQNYDNPIILRFKLRDL